MCERFNILLNGQRKRSPLLQSWNAPKPSITSKDILDVADGVMVARGDLGVELSPEDVPVIQKRVIAAANRAGVFVITATQMLESMTDHPRPTRAEASDVANAIFDGTDAVMLSGETAIGKYPVQTVQMMVRIIETAEASVEQAPPILNLDSSLSFPGCDWASRRCGIDRGISQSHCRIYPIGIYSAFNFKAQTAYADYCVYAQRANLSPVVLVLGC